jgi:hypothetical protein
MAADAAQTRARSPAPGAASGEEGHRGAYGGEVVADALVADVGLGLGQHGLGVIGPAHAPEEGRGPEQRHPRPLLVAVGSRGQAG